MAELIIVTCMLPLAVAATLVLRHRFPAVRQVHFAALWLVLAIALPIAAIVTSSLSVYYWTQARLAALDVDGTTVSIRGVEQDRRIVTELRGMGRYSAHHTSPVGHTRVVIRGPAGSLDLVLAHDSKLRYEVWIFVPWYSESTDIARVQSKPLVDLLWPDWTQL